MILSAVWCASPSLLLFLLILLHMPSAVPPFLFQSEGNAGISVPGKGREKGHDI